MNMLGDLTTLSSWKHKVENTSKIEKPALEKLQKELLPNYKIEYVDKFCILLDENRKQIYTTRKHIELGRWIVAFVEQEAKKENLNVTIIEPTKPIEFAPRTEQVKLPIDSLITNPNIKSCWTCTWGHNENPVGIKDGSIMCYYNPIPYERTRVQAKKRCSKYS